MSSLALRFCQRLLLTEAVKASAIRSVSVTPGMCTKTFRIDEKTHTGHVYDNHGDPNPKAGTMDKGQCLDESHPIDMPTDIPPTIVRERVVVCGGGKGRMSHSSVLINLDEPGKGVCGYCGQRFILDENYREELERDHTI